MNATVTNNCIIAKDNWIGPNVVIMKNTNEGDLFKPEHSKPVKISAQRFFKIKE